MGVERRIAQKCCFSLGKRHDNNILKMQLLLSRNVIVIALAPNFMHCKCYRIPAFSLSFVNHFLIDIFRMYWVDVCRKDHAPQKHYLPEKFYPN